MESKLELPEGITLTIEGDYLVVKGPKGTVRKKVLGVETKIEGKNVTFTSKKKQFCNTATALVKAAIVGVTEGYTDQLKVMHAHFPMTIEVKGKMVWVKNFIGEKVARSARIMGDAKVEVKKDIITVTGVDNYEVGQTSANLISATKIRQKDSRVFQDGIYKILD